MSNHKRVKVSDKYSQRDIFREILTLNPFLSYTDVMKITSRPERTVYKWMSGESEPDLFSLFLLRSALFVAGMKLPRDIYRCIDLYRSRALAWGHKNSTGDKSESVGDLQRVKKKFVYAGQLLSTAEIAKASDKNATTVFIKLKQFEVGADVTEAVNGIRSHRKS